MNNRQINKQIAALLGDEPTYDVYLQFNRLDKEVTLEQAENLRSSLGEDCYIITSPADAYVEDLNLSLFAAKKIAEKNEQTFVLSLENGTWKAAYGDWGNCAEHSGANPAYATCMAILKFMGKL